MEKKKKVKYDLQPLMSQAEVAKEIGVTRPMVAIIEKSALKKLRKALTKLGIKASDFFGE